MAPFAELPTYSSHPSLRAYLRAVLVAAKDLENIGRYREINGIELYRYVHAFVSSSLTSSFFASLFSAINPSITAKEASRIFNVIQATLEVRLFLGRRTGTLWRIFEYQGAYAFK